MGNNYEAAQRWYAEMEDKHEAMSDEARKLYPGAGETRAYLEEELRRQQLSAQLQQLQQTGGGQPAALQAQGTGQSMGQKPLLR